MKDLYIFFSLLILLNPMSYLEISVFPDHKSCQFLKLQDSFSRKNKVDKVHLQQKDIFERVS